MFFKGASQETVRMDKKSKQPKAKEETHDQQMELFFEEINEIRSINANIRGLIDNLKQVHSKSINSITETQREEGEKEQEELSNRIQEYAKTIKVKLGSIDKETKKMEIINMQNPNINIRKSQYSVLLTNLSDILLELKSIQEDQQARVSDRMVKQALVINPEATEAQVQKMVEKGNVFVSYNATQRAEVKAALDDIQRKHLEVNRIAKSILELNQLFMDIDVLIKAQGEQLDQAVNNISKTEKNIDSANQDLEKVSPH